MGFALASPGNKSNMLSPDIGEGYLAAQEQKKKNELWLYDLLTDLLLRRRRRISGVMIFFVFM